MILQHLTTMEIRQGLAEIETTAELIRNYVSTSKRWIVLTLHSLLSAEQQDHVFAGAY